MKALLRFPLEYLLALTVVLACATSCGREAGNGSTSSGKQVAPAEQPAPDPFSQPGVAPGTTPSGEAVPGQAAPGAVPPERRTEEDATGQGASTGPLPDLSGLSAIEREIFNRTIAIYGPFHDDMAAWAVRAEKIAEGTEAAKALRWYLDRQERFASDMDALDREMSPRLDPGFVPSEAFNTAVDRYLSGQNIVSKRDRFVGAYSNLIRRFKSDPACKSVFKDIERIAAEEQQRRGQ